MTKNEETTPPKKKEADEPSLDDYTTVRLPKELMEEIDDIIRQGIRGYKSRAEFIKEALRKRFEELNAAQPRPNLPALEHFNIDEQGVRILDRTLSSKTTKGRIIDVYFKPDNVWCDYCQSSSCRHIKFALDLPGSTRNPKQKRLEHPSIESSATLIIIFDPEFISLLKIRKLRVLWS